MSAIKEDFDKTQKQNGKCSLRIQDARNTLPLFSAEVFQQIHLEYSWAIFSGRKSGQLHNGVLHLLATKRVPTPPAKQTKFQPWKLGNSAQLWIYFTSNSQGLVGSRTMETEHKVHSTPLARGGPPPLVSLTTQCKMRLIL